jgi:FlaA1/EpsC-like NDP-sugar epimerase
MMKNVLNIVGWLGTALVVVAVALRVLRPEWDQYAVYGAWAGLVCVVLYTLGQYREIIEYFQQRNARYGAMASISAVIFLGVLVAANYLSNRQNRRWDLTKNQAFTPSSC